jgi:hypothetical protein
MLGASLFVFCFLRRKISKSQHPFFNLNKENILLQKNYLKRFDFLIHKLKFLESIATQ